MNTEQLEVGAFYWVLITFDPDSEGADEWVNEPMPARYAGDGRWTFLGVDDVSDWPVRWVGPKIDKPSLD